MTQPPKSEQDLIHEIRETWQSPKMTTWQSAQFKRDLHQRLSRPLPKKPLQHATIRDKRIGVVLSNYLANNRQ